MTLVAIATAVVVATTTAWVPPAGAALGDGTIVDNADINLPHGMVRDLEGNVWFGNTNTDDQTGDLGRIDVNTNQVSWVRSPEIGNIADVAVGPHGRIYFSSYDTDRVGYVDVEDGNEVVVFPAPSGAFTLGDPYGLAVARGLLWVASNLNDKVVVLDPDTGAAVAVYQNMPDVYDVLAHPNGSVYVSLFGSDEIQEFGLLENETHQIGEDCTPYQLALGPEDEVYATCHQEFGVTRFDPATETFDTQTDPSTFQPWGIAAGPDGRMWIGLGDDDTHMSWTPPDPFTRYDTPGIVDGAHVAVDGRGWVWIGGYSSGNLLRVEPGQRFTDVPLGHAFGGWIGDLANSGITGGFTDGTYRPAANVTRQAMVAFLYRMAGEPLISEPNPHFSDVPLGHPFYVPIEWARNEGISSGFTDGTFRPGGTVTRQAMAALLFRQVPDAIGGSSTFTDVFPNHPFDEEISWLADEGIAGGFPDGSFRPSAPVTRQAMAAFLMRFQALDIMRAPPI